MMALANHDIVTADHLSTLIAARGVPCISIYMPTVRGGDQTRQNPIRFKNLCSQIEAELARRYPDSADLIESINALAEDELTLWAQRSDGLALFAARDLLLHFQLPLAFETSAVVGERFHVLPLLPALRLTSPFYTLVLDLNDVALYDATAYDWTRVDLGKAPTSLREHLRFTERERHLQQHSIGVGSGTMFHGQGSAGDESIHKQDVRDFFLAVDRAVCAQIGEARAPLILVGSGANRAVYEEITHCKKVSGGIDLDPAARTDTAVHRRALRVVDALADQALEDAIARLRARAHDADAAALGLERIVPAAHYGRVSALYAPPGLMARGQFDAASGQVTLGADDGEDLLNRAAVDTLINGGEVYALEPGEQPAALLRY